MKTDFRHFAEKKTFHRFRLIFPRPFSHPWKVCLWRSLVFCSSSGLASPCPTCACHRRPSRCCSAACCSCSQPCCCSFYLACSNCCPGRPAPAPRGKGSIDF